MGFLELKSVKMSFNITVPSRKTKTEKNLKKKNYLKNEQKYNKNLN